MKIPCYIIMGSAGIYSDWSTWPVKVMFGKETDAQIEAVRIEDGVRAFMKEQSDLGRLYEYVHEDALPTLQALDATRTWLSADAISYSVDQSFVELSDLELLNNLGLQMMEESARLENIQHSLS